MARMLLKISNLVNNMVFDANAASTIYTCCRATANVPVVKLFNKRINMKSIHFLKNLFVVLALVTFIAGCAGTSTRESTGEYIDDTTITTKVKAEIFNDPMLKVLQINVESYKGVVQLSGFVDSRQAIERAVQIAGAVEGVKGVENSLVVK